ncbi:SDR family oxidoreductase [Anaeromyxobacter paludicola]|uniref:3-beta hydroxysteroid dehydrogenase n=1 Tax=Anaeromyxobacter paludicola TaxID=2918171 RepID=A0ABM7X8S8_9BACT|nr:SDR family oxidoreductase [Anaeromyxobacter paludicola]BDG08244.1 3-beta hydroxysteroid dehydrogenase [Anaeromyxobacter paludicola]
MGGPAAREVVFVTGYPGFIARRLVQRLARELSPGARLTLLVEPSQLEAARAAAADLPLRPELLEGDVSAMHLGLSGPEFKRLAAEVTCIWHLAAVKEVSAGRDRLRRVNVEGTRNALDLARSAPGLRRFHHFSSAWVSGDRTGVILEDELEFGQGFHDAYEESKYRAEVLVKRAAADRLPVTVYRPSIVVGDSRTGEIDRFEGPYALAILLLASPLTLPLPLPGDGAAPLNVVPVDFVVESAVTIGRNPAAVGRTVHLVDPAPLSARRVYELVAAREHRRLPPMSLPARAVDAILRLPVLERLTRSQRSAIEAVSHGALYNCRNTLELLEGTGVRCPPLTAYLDRLTEFVKEQYARRRAARALEVDDPLDDPPAPPRRGAAPERP